MWIRTLIALSSLALAANVDAQQARDADANKQIVGRGFDKLSPFRAMRQVGDGIEVQIDDDTWYRLERVGGLDTASMIRRTRASCGNRWFERVSEDLVEVLTVLDKAPGNAVDLQVRRLDNNKTVELADTPMTRNKRQRLLMRNKGKESDKRRARESLTTQGMVADVQQLGQLLDDHFSYRELQDISLQSMIREAAQRLGKQPGDKTQLAIEVDAILRHFGDGHTRLRGGSSLARRGYLPFLVEKAAEGYVAFKADRSGLVDEKRPFLKSIDGKPLEDWLVAARARATQGSPHFVEHQAVRNLRFLEELRSALGHESSDLVQFVLTGPAGTKQHTLRTNPRRRPIYGSWPRDARHTKLDGNLGYLRIDEMTSDENVLDALDDAMANFRKTRGLVIDVRGNGGGTRAILRRLFPYFMKKNEAPHVANIAAYRMPPGTGEMPNEGWLDNRWLYPAGWDGWTKAQRTSIAKAKKRFRPEWTLPKGKFSDWHYFVLDRSANPNAYHYDKPVVVLLDRGCFSATDIFLGALKGWRGVTMIGTPSGGGSGRSRGHRLDHSGLELRISSMASFRANGQLYERRGIRPDIVVERKPHDLVDPSKDYQLEMAISRLR